MSNSPRQADPLARSMTLGLSALVLGALGHTSVHAQIEVIFTEVPSHPTAIVPGAVDLAGDPIVVEFKAMEDLSVRSDGSQWIIKGRHYGGSDIETMLLMGSGTSGSVLAQEGQPVDAGEPGEVYDFFSSTRPSFNELGQYVFIARARNGDPSIKQKGIMWDGSQFMMMRNESDPALGLIDLPPNPSGDELFGNSFGSMHLLNDGTIGYHDLSLTNISSLRRPAVFYNDDAFRQSGVSGIGGDMWTDMDSVTFATTPDGDTWMLEGDDSSDHILVVNDAVVIREGEVLPGSTMVVADVFQPRLIDNGDWVARGDDTVDDDWVARNGVHYTSTGTPITGEGGEAWSNVIVAVAGNSLGDVVVAGKTNSGTAASDDVLVLNNEQVLAREGDPVDLDGNGLFDDDAFIGRGNLTSSAFQANDLFITEDRVVYFLAELRNAANQDLGGFGTGGDAFLRIALDEESCAGDVNNTMTVDVQDLVQIILGWGPCDPKEPCPADVTDDGLVNVQDLVTAILNWGPCP